MSERHALIPPLLGDGATVRELSAALGVDRRTVGRDLAALYRAGRVRILPVRGGVWAGFVGGVQPGQEDDMSDAYHELLAMKEQHPTVRP